MQENTSIATELTEVLRYAGYRGKIDEAAPELIAKIKALAAEAPIVPRSVCKCVGEALYLVGTIGAEFDRWQRRLSVKSAADALLAQAIGAAAVEKVMDEVEARAKAEIKGAEFGPRRSPGYGEMPLALSREILEKTEAAKILGVYATADNLLVPAKSVTAICVKVKGKKV